MNCKNVGVFIFLVFLLVGCAPDKTISSTNKKKDEPKTTVNKTKPPTTNYSIYKKSVSSFENKLNKPLLSYLSDWLSLKNNIEDMMSSGAAMNTVPISDVDKLNGKFINVQDNYTKVQIPGNLPSKLTNKLNDLDNLYFDVITKSNKYMSDYECYYKSQCLNTTLDTLTTDMNEAIDTQNSYLNNVNDMNKPLKIAPLNYDTPAKETPTKAPQIGMTKEEVKASTWGEPEKVNTTTTTNDKHEQWVYPGDRYLYFDNGKLTAIQDSN